MSVSKKGARITVSLSEEDHIELTALAEQSQVSLSWLARAAISDFLERYRDEELQLPLLLKQTKGGR